MNKTISEIRDELASQHRNSLDARPSQASKSFKEGFEACLKVLSERAGETFDKLTCEYACRWVGEARDVFFDGARWQHSQSQSKIEGLGAEIEQFKSTARGFANGMFTGMEDAAKLFERAELYKAALNKINDPKRLRNLSKLAVNPPLNSAVRDIQLIAKEVLNKTKVGSDS